MGRGVLARKKADERWIEVSNRTLIQTRYHDDGAPAWFATIEWI
jgi:hypothetical protein